MIKVSVIDSGEGIKAEDKSKIFKLFGQNKEDRQHKINSKNIGLGLVISKLIVEKFNGSISFISKFKKGSSFTYSIEIELLLESDIL